MKYFSIPIKSAGITSTILAILVLLYAKAYPAENRLGYDIFIFENRLTVDFDFANFFRSDLVTSIKKGFPLHIDFKTELKKSIPIWFDPTLDHYQAYINIEYRSFGARYQMSVLDFSGKQHRLAYKQLKNMISGLNEILILECDSVRKYNPDDNLYFTYEVEMRRLTADEISHAGAWYRGKGSDERDTSWKIASKHENIFDQILDMTGLGPSKYHYSSYIFKPSALKEVRP